MDLLHVFHTRLSNFQKNGNSTVSCALKRSVIKINHNTKLDHQDQFLWRKLKKLEPNMYKKTWLELMERRHQNTFMRGQNRLKVVGEQHRQWYEEVPVLGQTFSIEDSRFCKCKAWTVVSNQAFGNLKYKPLLYCPNKKRGHFYF